jgi:hypothetical protein
MRDQRIPSLRDTDVAFPGWQTEHLAQSSSHYDAGGSGKFLNDARFELRQTCRQPLGGIPAGYKYAPLPRGLHGKANLRAEISCRGVDPGLGGGKIWRKIPFLEKMGI